VMTEVDILMISGWLWYTVQRYSGCLQADSAQQIEGMQQPASEALPLTTNDNDDHVTSESLALPPGDVTAEDPDVITTDSLTLPRIEHVLRSKWRHQRVTSQQQKILTSSLLTHWRYHV